MGWGDVVPDRVKDGVESAVEKGGEITSDVGDKVADRLEDAGWKDGARHVRRSADAVGNRMGADVDERGLDEVNSHKELIHGSPSKIRATADHLNNFKKVFNQIGRTLKGLDSSELRGESAEAFRQSASVQPKKWFTAADACEKAASALEDYAGTLSWAQDQALQAFRDYRKAERASEAHQKRVDAYNEAADAYNDKPASERDPDDLPKKPPSTDPGASGRKEAQERLARARKQRDSAAETAASAVRTARDTAPDKPSYSERASDGLTAVKLDAQHIAGGGLRGLSSVATHVRSHSAVDPYNLAHPGEFLTNLNSTADGLAQTARDPAGTAKQMATEFSKDPAEGFGRLAPELIGGKGTGAARKAAGTAGKAGRAADPPKNPGRKAADDEPHSGSRERENSPSGRDPVDFATGRMFLAETDAVLPGTLPLVFSRCFESSYRAGGWFGPTWSSTADQRLEIDAQGVVFHGEDNLLLAYPHPAPGVPTLPHSGPRWELERTPEGDYTLHDPEQGWTRHFTRPDPDLAPSDPVAAAPVPGAASAAPGTSTATEAPPTGADGTARLAELTDRGGHRLTFEYGEDGAPCGIVHSGGYYLRLTTEAGRITALHLAGAAPDGGDQPLAHYAYQDGHLTEVNSPSGKRLRFTYDTAGRITSWTDSNDSRYQYAYDEQHRCIWQSGDAGHLRSTFEYTDPDATTGHRTTRVTDSHGHTSTYLVNERCQVIAETDPLGHTVRTERDRHHQVLSHTDALGGVTRVERDARGRPRRVVLPDGASTSVTYGAVGLPEMVTGPDGAVWRHAWDDRGNRTAVTDPAGHTTHYTHDAHGHLSAVTDALGHTTQVVCDPAGLPVEITDPLGATTRYQRDAFGRPVRVIDPLGAATVLEWTVEGHLARRTGPDGAVEEWSYDGEGNPTRHTDPAGNTSHFAYDHFDVLAARTDPGGARHTFTHDAELRLTQVTNPQGLTWTYTYDPAGRLASETDFDQRTTHYTHNATGQLTTRTTPLGQTLTYTHDPAGRLTRKEADGEVTTYTYDPAGRLTHAATPHSELLYQRDRLGRIKTEMQDGRVTTHTWDALGRETHRTTPTGSTTTYTYDPAGNQTTLTTDGHTLHSTHTPTGHELTRHIDHTLTLAHTYDPAGRLTTQTLTHTDTDTGPGMGAGASAGSGPGAGAGAAGMDSGIGAGTDAAGMGASPGIGVDAGLGMGTGAGAGANAHASAGIGTGAGISVGTNGPLDPPPSHSSRRIQRRAYTYTPTGHLAALDDQLRGTSHFTLDPTGQVTTVHAPNWSEHYTYDPAGNQTHATWPDHHPVTASRGQRTYTGTRLHHAGRLRYHHDAAGRVVMRQKQRLSRKPDTWHYTYNAENQLTHVTTPDGTHWRYHYDPLGRRTTKQRLAPTHETVLEQTQFTWDGPTLIEQTTTTHPDLPHPVTLTWNHHGLHPVTQTERLHDATTQREIDARFYAITTDLIGTPTELTDTDGHIAWHTRTTLWGTTTWNHDATTYTPLRFPGQYHDPETGLHYNHHRHYDPETAHYTTPDPLGLAPAPNPTTYTTNPHTQTDYLGLAPDGCPRKLGVSHSAQRAIEKLENIKQDPVGDINSQPGHNHYSAARREALGEVVARRGDGVPFDHIQDLKQARAGLDKVRRTLEREMDSLPEGITERGLDVLITKHKETVYHLDSLNGFLRQIGHR